MLYQQCSGFFNTFKELRCKPTPNLLYLGGVKRLFIIAGPNGAGKTTASFTILPELLDCQEFVNADEIARGLSPLDPDGAAFAAGRIMLERIDDLMNAGEDFAFETTLSSRSLLSMIIEAKKSGYLITLMFFHLHSPKLALNRVRTRVKEGGHNIPEEVIIRRYSRGLRNFFQLYKDEVPDWVFVENSGRPYNVIAMQQGRKQVVHIPDIWDVLTSKFAR